MALGCFQRVQYGPHYSCKEKTWNSHNKWNYKTKLSSRYDSDCLQNALVSQITFLITKSSVMIHDVMRQRLIADLYVIKHSKLPAINLLPQKCFIWLQIKDLASGNYFRWDLVQISIFFPLSFELFLINRSIMILLRR